MSGDTTQPQRLYAVLRANAGRLTSYPDIWRAVWGDAPPKWAATELRTMISEIRGKLPPGAKIKAVNTRGYTLLLPARVDREPFPPSPVAPAPKKKRQRVMDNVLFYRERLAETAHKRKQRTCLACGRTFLSAHAGNRLCERHNGASATPWESGYRVTGVRVSA